MVKQPTSEPSEFTMSSEDFPALPGTQNREGPSPGGSVSGDKNIPVGLGPEIGQDVLQANRAPGSEKSQSSKRGIQTLPEGKLKCCIIIYALTIVLSPILGMVTLNFTYA